MESSNLGQDAHNDNQDVTRVISATPSRNTANIREEKYYRLNVAGELYLSEQELRNRVGETTWSRLVAQHFKVAHGKTEHMDLGRLAVADSLDFKVKLTQVTANGRPRATHSMQERRASKQRRDAVNLEFIIAYLANHAAAQPGN